MAVETRYLESSKERNVGSLPAAQYPSPFALKLVMPTHTPFPRQSEGKSPNSSV